MSLTRGVLGNGSDMISEFAGSVNQGLVRLAVLDVFIRDPHALANVLHRILELCGEEVGETVLVRPFLADVVLGFQRS